MEGKCIRMSLSYHFKWLCHKKGGIKPIQNAVESLTGVKEEDSKEATWHIIDALANS